MGAYNKDLINFGPAVGFAWQIPWFGKGKTTLRGGYQTTYIPIFDHGSQRRVLKCLS